MYTIFDIIRYGIKLVKGQEKIQPQPEPEIEETVILQAPTVFLQEPIPSPIPTPRPIPPPKHVDEIEDDGKPRKKKQSPRRKK